MKKITFIFTLFITMIVFAAFNDMSIAEFTLKDVDTCEETGNCDFILKIANKDRVLKKSQLLKNKDEYKIIVDFGNGDRYKNVLGDCIDEGFCKIEKLGNNSKRVAIIFTNEYEENDNYNVVLKIKGIGNDTRLTAKTNVLVDKQQIPVCKYAGSRSEAWYWMNNDSRTPIDGNYSFCSRYEEPTCEKIGSRSEGWYTTNIQTGERVRITWAQCGDLN